MKNNLIIIFAIAIALCFLIPTAVSQTCSSSIFNTNTDGTCHDLSDTDEGEAGSSLNRIGGRARFRDGVGSLDNRNRPNPRVVSNTVCRDRNVPNIKRMSRLTIFIGQFIDHDLTLTLEEEGEGSGVFANIQVPGNDDRFDEPIEFRRSEFFIGNGQRQFRTENTAWLDLGSVYGDSISRTNLLRASSNGLMRVSTLNSREFPPLDSNGQSLCGDVRCEENIMLFAFHTLFLREHNRLARLVRASRPSAGNNNIFLRARLLNIMQYQSIVWDSYLPYILGRRSFAQITGPYRGPTGADPDPTVFFSTAVYRYGHSGVSNDLRFTNLNGNAVRSTVALSNSFGAIGRSTIGIVRSSTRNRMAAIFAGQSIVPHPLLDQRVVGGLRQNLLANAPERRDLIALNIQRGRDHGLQSLNFYRTRLGLPAYNCDGTVRCFRELTGGDNTLAQQLFVIYNTIELGDPWVLGMAEAPRVYQDSQLGDTFTVAMAENFNRMRNGDRIWFENILGSFSNADLFDLQFPSRLSDVIKNNLAQDLSGLDQMESGFAIDPVYPAFVGGRRYQVEWVIPESARSRTISRFEIRAVATLSSGSTITRNVQVSGNQLFYFDQAATANANYQVRVVARFSNNAGIVIGTVNFRTLSSGQDLNPLNEEGLSVGAAVGIGAAAIAGVGFFAFVAFSILKRRKSTNEMKTELI